MSKLMIAVCEFSGGKSGSMMLDDDDGDGSKKYEYLVELPDDANLDDYKYGVTLTQAHAEDANAMKTKRLLSRLQVVFIREFREIIDQVYTGELQRLVIAFSMSPMIEHAIRRQRISTLKANLERRLSEMSVFEKIKAMGIESPDINAMAEELKKLLGKG